MAGYSYNISSPFDVRLPITPENVDDNPIMYAELSKIYNAIRTLQAALTLYTGASMQDASVWSLLTPAQTILAQNLNRLYVQAGETVLFGDMINLYDLGGGILGARKANAASGTPRPCFAWCSTPGGITSGSYGEVICGPGLCNGVSGMTIGTTYYLSTTAGIITNGKPASPNLLEPIGFAVATNLLYFMPALVY